MIPAFPVEVAAASQQGTLSSMQHNAEKEFRLALDDITKLIEAGRDKCHLSYNEVKDLIPHDVHSPEDLDDVLTTIGTRGIDVLESQPKLPSLAFEKQFGEEVEAGERDLTPDALEKTNDPVRIYLRAMGIVPLLTREGEVDIAKRIERGQRKLRGMAVQPELVKVNEFEYRCSVCEDFRIPVGSPILKSESQWRQNRGQQFLEHMKLCHSGGGVNMVTTKLPPHLMDDRGVKRCSVCKMPFPPDTQPSLSKAFAAHLLKAHKPGQTSEDFSQAAFRAVKEATDKV